MFKLYFKKLFFTLLLIFGLFPILSAVCVFVWHLLFRYMFPEAVRDAVCYILGGLLSLYVAYLFRVGRAKRRTEYVNAFPADTFSFCKDFASTFKSGENLVHTLAYLTYDLFQTIGGAIDSDSPFLRAVIITVILVAIRSLLFSAINTLLWSLVHRKWMRFLHWRNAQEDIAS